MIKKALAVVLAFLIVVSMAMPAYCDDALRKLGRGISNVITCPFEIFNQGSKVFQSDGPMAAGTYGVLKGVGMMGLRAIVGVYEVVSFPVPFPKNYEPILKDPEFFFQDKLG